MRCLFFLQRLSLVGVIALIASTGQAKDLSSRLGVGFRDAFPFEMPAIAVQYYPNSELGLFSALGVDTKENYSQFGLQLGVRKIIFKEDHMNFFMGGALSLLTQEIASVKNSGYDLAALVGGEFFLSGLDNLGFNFETGVAVTSLDKVRFRTLGDHVFRAGMIFYF